jgi:phosphoribosylaminoimidazole-succinocarboxamide synthase
MPALPDLGLPPVYAGKIRDVYADGEDVVLVASDRVSVYDVVLPTPIPEKGQLLTQLSLWWFDQLAEVAPNHVISGTDVPPQWAGRAVRCQRLDMIEVECIARGYLAGLGLREYQKTGTVSGVPLPPGLVEGSKLPEPIFTPTTKSAPGAGVHDEFITYPDVERMVGADVAAHVQPESYEATVLTVRADSTAWATQVRLLAAELVRRINQRIGHGTVTKVNVRGPQARSWSKGLRSVPGRGPRDTYG